MDTWHGVKNTDKPHIVTIVYLLLSKVTFCMFVSMIIAMSGSLC